MTDSSNAWEKSYTSVFNELQKAKKEIQALENVITNLSKDHQEAKELLQKSIKAMGSVTRKQEQFDLSLKIQTFLNKI